MTTIDVKASVALTQIDGTQRTGTIVARLSVDLAKCGWPSQVWDGEDPGGLEIGAKGYDPASLRVLDITEAALVTHIDSRPIRVGNLGEDI